MSNIEKLNIKVVVLNEIYNFAGKTFSFKIALVSNIHSKSIVKKIALAI